MSHWSVFFMAAGLLFIVVSVLMPKNGKFAVFGWFAAYHLAIFGAACVYTAFVN